MSLLIGADPEVFAVKNGAIISGHHLIPGTKEEPHNIGIPGMHVQVDGMALEFNVPPSSDSDVFSKDIDTLLSTLQRMIGEDYSLSTKRSNVFTKGYMKSLPKKARELGCDPDWNAYTIDLNKINRSLPTLRTVGGHVHLGWGEDCPVDAHEYIQAVADMAIQLDCSIGMQSVILDDDTQRRSLYGQAGAFRAKSYGMEYRTLSNYWIFEESFRKMVFHTTSRAYTDFIDDLRYVDELHMQGVERIHIRNTINNSDVDTAKEILHHLKIRY